MQLQQELSHLWPPGPAWVGSSHHRPCTVGITLDALLCHWNAWTCDISKTYIYICLHRYHQPVLAAQGPCFHIYIYTKGTWSIEMLRLASHSTNETKHLASKNWSWKSARPSHIHLLKHAICMQLFPTQTSIYTYIFPLCFTHIYLYY